MSKFRLPNIRKIFLPDPGYVICDCDLSGADAQVVAWDAKDEKLKRAFREGLNIHNFNGEAIWGKDYDPKKIMRGTQTMRDQVKRGVHGTNYGGSARTIAITLSWRIAEAEDFQRRWFAAHPEIKEWHRRVEYDLSTSRKVSNAFGYRIVYFDRPANLLPKALAWIPQSTVANVCGRGAVQLAGIPWVEVLLQVHDSVVFQIPFHKLSTKGLADIRSALEVVVPYPNDPLIIPWELSISEKSWGDVAKLKWSELEKESSYGLTQNTNAVSSEADTRADTAYMLPRLSKLEDSVRPTQECEDPGLLQPSPSSSSR